MGRRLAPLLLLVPGIALGQGAVTALTSTQSQSDLANRSDCASTSASATWNWTSSVTPATGNTYRLAAYAAPSGSSGGCQTSAPALGTTNAVINSDQTATGVTGSYSPVSLNLMATAGGVTSCTGAFDVEIALCVYIMPAGTLVSQGTFTFQLAIPPAPIINSVSPNDGSLTVNVSPGTTNANETATTGVTYTVTCAPASGSGGSGSGTGNAGNITCGGLTDGVQYTVTATGVSAAGNQGPVSATWPAGQDTTPLPFQSFWQIYKGANGVEAGGCGAGGIGALAPFGALLALLALRRRRS